MKKSKYVITVARQFGSLGRPIAKLLSEKLGIEYYDRDIVDQAAKELNLPVSTVDEAEELAKRVTGNGYGRMIYPLGKGTTALQDKIFASQQNIIRFFAERENCVIVGRCSDFVLENYENVIHIYIHAPYEDRVQNCVETLHMDVKEARKMIVKVDEARELYHLQYAGFKPDDKNHKDIILNSSLLGVEKSAEFLADLVNKKFLDV